MTQTRFPPGWDEARVRRTLGHYEDQAPAVAAMSPDDAREQHGAALRDVAEALLTLGANDAELIVALADLRDAEERLARDDAELESLDARMASVDQGARTRESALRGAIADLRFVVTQAREDAGTVDATVAAQVRALEARLARLTAEHEQDIRELTDRAVAVTAARADTAEQVDRLYAALAQPVDRLLPEFWGDPGLLQLATKLHAARAALTELPQRG